MDLRYTRHQIPRGTRPDAVSGQDRYLIKNVTRLRLTYQLRLATFMASQTGTRLHVRVPQGCQLSPPLEDFIRLNRGAVSIERAG